MTLKRAIGRLLPYPLIKGARKLYHFGPRTCRLCGGRIRKLHPTVLDYAMLTELEVVGGMPRPADRCPLCHATARDRLIWFYLVRHHFPSLEQGPACTVAHFAPEKGLSEQLLARFGSQYSAYDINPARYRHLAQVERQDLGALTLPDESVDLLLCNHVIEHVPSVEAALGEVCRVLRPSGLALMQVPLSLKLERMRDGGHDKSPAERIALYGKDDHLRLFTPAAYREALERAGFVVTEYRAFEDDPQAAQDWQLDPLEPLYLIRRA